MTRSVPVAFVSHGAPVSLEDGAWVEALLNWGHSFRDIREILVLSAHWVAGDLLAGPTDPVPLLYDFYGFPERFYRKTYPCSPSAYLIERLPELLGRGSVSFLKSRGLDHGMWVPLSGLFPAANLPVLGLSIPGLSPPDLFRLGESLSPLRQEGILIVCSGGITHNLRDMNADMTVPPVSWALEFDRWVSARLLSGDFKSILEFESLAPFAARAHPTVEHFAPLFVALGASRGGDEGISFPVEGFRWGTLSFRSVQFGRV